MAPANCWPTLPRVQLGPGIELRERKLLVRQSSTNWRSPWRVRNLQWRHPLTFGLSSADRRCSRRGQGPALRAWQHRAQTVGANEKTRGIVGPRSGRWLVPQGLCRGHAMAHQQDPPCQTTAIVATMPIQPRRRIRHIIPNNAPRARSAQ